MRRCQTNRPLLNYAKHVLAITMAVAMAGALSLSAASAAPTDQIGFIQKKAGDVYGTPPGEKRGRIYYRAKIVIDERIETDGGAAAVIRFFDKTDLYLSEHSDLLIDDYVYNRKKGKGDDRAIYNLGVGAFRFVSGAMQQQKIEIVTTKGLIGIRGSDAILFVSEDETVVNVFSGSFSVRGRERENEAPVVVTAEHNVRIGAGGMVSAAENGFYIPPGKEKDFKILRPGGPLESARRGNGTDPGKSDKDSGGGGGSSSSGGHH